MAGLSETEATRLSTEAAEHFVDGYYTTLNGSRSRIANFYIPSTTLPSGRTLPHISYNGELVQDPNVFQERYEKQMPWTHFEPQSVNVHVLNPCLSPPIEGQRMTRREAEMNMSLTVMVSGYVRLVERKDGPMRGFSDNFVLVPNKEDVGGRGMGKQGHGMKWLIQSQNFRFVV